MCGEEWKKSVGLNIITNQEVLAKIGEERALIRHQERSLGKFPPGKFPPGKIPPPLHATDHSDIMFIILHM